MINRSFFLLTFLLLASPVQALMVDIPHNEFTSNTNTHTPIELKPISFNNSYKIAAVCFMGFGDCTDNALFQKNTDEYALDTEKQCKNEGFTITSCTVPQYVNSPCLYNGSFYASCVTDNARACQEAGFVNSCSSGEKLKDDDRCQWDNTYGKCCSTCMGYEYDEKDIPDGYVKDGEGCTSCDGIKFRIKINPCDGYKECDMGGAAGAKTCLSGTVKKFSSCKSCPSNCFGECPDGAICFKCDGRYCIQTCMSGYWSYENYYCNNALQCLLPKK